MLTYLRHVGVSGNSKKIVEAKCECGFVFLLREDALKAGTTSSCGCQKRARMKILGIKSRTHNKTHTPEYVCWQHVLRRCLYKKTKGYQYYGGRGITVCDRWRFSFDAFFGDMGKRPSNEYSIDRIDVNGNYEPGNCRWATRSEQSRNRRPFTRKKGLTV